MVENQRKTFLSYSRVNKDFALRLARELKAEGLNIWLDQLDIPTGVRWDREVERALRESEIFMIILTPASIDSENVLDEIGYAIDTGKRFLPVLLEKCDVPLRIRRFQYVDFTDKSFDDGVESAKELLRDLIALPTLPQMETPAIDGKQTKAEWKAREEAKYLAAQKAEEDAKREATEDAIRLVKQKSEEKQIEKKQEHQTQPTDVQVIKPLLKSPRLVANQAFTKKSRLPLLLIGGISSILLFAVCVVVGISAFRLFISDANSPVQDITANNALTVTNTATQTPVSITATQPPTSTAIPKFVLLDTLETSKSYTRGQGKGIYETASEQYSDADLKVFEDEHQPIPVTLDNSEPIFIGHNWSATTDAILLDNLKYIQVVIYIDGERISDEYLTEIRFTDTDSDGMTWRCVWIIVGVGQWASGEHTVRQELNITQTINDGMDNYGPEYLSTEYVVTIP